MAQKLSGPDIGAIPLDDLLRCSVALSVAVSRQVWVWHPRGHYVVNLGARPGKKHDAPCIARVVGDQVERTD